MEQKRDIKETSVYRTISWVESFFSISHESSFEDEIRIERIRKK